MAIVFTICSNNYLAQASVLEQSIKEHNSSIKFFTILVDEYSTSIDYLQLNFTCIEIKEIEPNINSLIEKYDIIQLNTCVKPKIFEYFFSKYEDLEIIYFDPDIKIYSSLQELKSLLNINNIILTPHIFTPIPLDGKTPDENNFLNYGIYNLGFIGVKKSDESIKFIDWWKKRTYSNGYIKVCEGIFVDQLYINLVPLFFKSVFIITDRGYNMAPWNLHERYLTKENDIYYVNKFEKLKFFHFSSFKLGTGELPLHYYNRFNMYQRQDLQSLFSDYNDELFKAKYAFYKTIKCVYAEKYSLIKIQKDNLKQLENWNKKPLYSRVFIKSLNKLPVFLLNKLRNAINQSPPTSN